MRKIIMFLVLTASLLMGCQTWAEYYGTTPKDIQAALNQQIGILKYDDSLSYWGEPISIFNGDNIFIVTWGSEKVGPVITSVIPIGDMVFAKTGQKQSGWKLVATFHKDTRLLTNIIRTVW